MNSAQKLGLSAAYGTASTVGSLVGTPAAGTTAIDISRQGVAIYGTQWNSVTGTPATQTVAGQMTFCLPILSGTIGLGAEKFLPLGMLSDDIRCEFTFEQNNIAVVYNQATQTAGWSITDFQLELAIVELSDEGQSLVDSYISNDHPLYIHGVSNRHYTQQMAGQTTGGISYLIPARFGSLKNLFVCPRRNTDVGSVTSYSLSSRINPNLAQYWWRFGSALLPAKPVTLENSNNSTAAYAEAFMELQKSFHSVSSPANASVLPALIYNVADQGTSVFTSSTTVNPTSLTVQVQPVQTGINSYRNGFLIGQELESFALRSDVLLSGYNTLSQQIFFEAQINTQTSSNIYTFDFFATYDQILVLENGILSVRF